MADDRKVTSENIRERATATDIEGGTGSEHEQQVYGMRHAPEDREQRQADRADTPPEATDDDVETRRLRTTSYTAMDDEAAEEGEQGLAPRTAYEMSLHDELSRTPTGDESDEEGYGE